MMIRILIVIFRLSNLLMIYMYSGNWLFEFLDLIVLSWVVIKNYKNLNISV